MLQKVHIENFQSLHDVEVELDGLTVIVGPSSSGKSAFTRALKTLTSNARGDAFISHGEQTCTITAYTDKGVASISRGKKNEYTLIPSNSEKKIFTKLAGAVPEEVSEFIGIPAKDPLNYSSQFDMPYLLTASAGEVARTLGELTNVHVIFEASREANRQRLTSTQILKTRAADLQQTRESLERFSTLADQQAAAHDAQEHYTGAVELSHRLTHINSTITAARAAQQALETITTHQESLPDLTALNTANQRLKRIRGLINTATSAYKSLEEIPPAVEIPDIQKLQLANKKLRRLVELTSTARAAAHLISSATATLTTSTEELLTLRAEHTAVLQQAGTCPTCGTNTKEITHGH